MEFDALADSHLDEVLAIEQASFPQPWTRGMFEREISLPISHFFIARGAEGIVGYGGYWHIEDEAHLVNFAVHPGARRRGVGRRLMTRLIEHMEGNRTKRILLEVRRSNHPAQNLYVSFGFAVTGVRPKYYCTEDAILMEKRL